RSTKPTLVQGTAFGTGARVSKVTVPLTRPVAQGDLLVGWFGQYNAPEQVRVSDDVNGTWTRAPRAQTSLDDTGDIALYYRQNSGAAPGGMTITVSVSSTAFLQGTVADYSGVALAGALDQIASARVPDGTAVDTGATAAVGAGELVFAAVVTGTSPGSVTPGSSLGVPYTSRAQTSTGASYEEDITSSARGAQHGTATLASPSDWYAVCAVFHPLPPTPPAPPEFIPGAAASPATRLTSYTLALLEPVLAGDLLVGWFGQFNAPGQVHVSDNVNGPWTRSVSTTWSGTGDIALFYRENSAPAPSGLVVTVSASASAYLQEAFADFRGVATVGALDQAVIAQGQGTYASVGPTGPVPAGELVVAAVLTGGQPGYATPGSSQRVPYVLDVHNGCAASDLEDILSSADGPQEGSLTLGRPDNWYMVLATFVPAGASTTTTSPGSTTTTPPTTTTTSTSTTTTTTLPGTTSGVTSSANPSVSGQPVTFTATVKAKTAGAGIPTGTVTFKDGPSALGTGTLNGAGQATFVTRTLAVGAHPITASYGGDATFSGSTSSTLTETVKKASTATVVSSSANPSLTGQAETFTATVTAKSPGAGTPSGKVTFKDGETAITNCSNLSLNKGQASCTTSSLSVGSHSITATYGGSSTFLPSTSPALTQTVN